MGNFRMDSIPKTLLTLCAVVTLVSVVNAENHPARFDNFEEERNSINDDPINQNDYRLPKSIIPNNYNIKIIEINFKDFTFSGTSTIKANVQEPVNEIVLNAGSIVVDVIAVLQNKINVDIAGNNPYPKTERFKISLKDTLTVNSNIEIILSFKGKLRDDMIGFYKSVYYDEEDNQRFLAATQFESTHARHAFPCFDEPEFKATFDISIKAPDGYNCLSNMKVNVDEKNVCRFDTSPQMSTYLVAFVISEFKSFPINNNYFKIWTRPNALLQASYAHTIGVKALEILNDLFGHDYLSIMTKMDMVAIPDFSAGAMENWGLITYRETAALYDENHSSDIAQQRVASVIVHECTHMWFGNLVTPEWWTYLWLSEGFARYYQYRGTDMIEENWKMDEQFVVEQFQAAMVVDSAEDSKPMTRQEQDMITPAQIETAGGTITYAKGASIVRMMEKSFGTKNFQQALQKYIQDRKFKSAKPEHMWRALQDVLNSNNAEEKFSVETAMKTWTEQAGYPVISVEVSSDAIKLKQERFLLHRNDKVPRQLWSVPITISSFSNPTYNTEPIIWLKESTSQLENKNKNDTWLILNAQSAGFYRVNYDMDSWNRIIKLLMSQEFEKIQVINRASIIDDLFNLARAEFVDYELFFRGIQYLKREKHYLPFKSALTGLDYLTRMTVESSDYEFFKKYITSLIKDVYNELTFDDKPSDDRLNILLRQEFNSRLCDFDDVSCVKRSRDYFNNWKENNITVPKNQRSVVYCTAIKHGSSQDWEFLRTQYQKTNVAAEQVTILTALGCSQDPVILEKYLLDALSDFEKSRIRKQDLTTVFNGIYTASLKNAEFIINFAYNTHAPLFNYFKSYDVIGSLITNSLQRYPIKKLMDKVEQIVKSNAQHIAQNAASIKKSLDFVKKERNLFDKYLPPVIDSIKEMDPSSENTTAYRLTDSVIPKMYTIFLTPHISPEEKFTFDGQVTITADVKRAVDKITLHVDQLHISKVTIKTIDAVGNSLNIRPYEKLKQREKYHFFDIIMKERIMSGTKISIEMTYTGTLNTEMRGFYRSSYKTKNETRWLAATHLEPTGARRVFPCFDEPALKANFSISVQAPKNYGVISNTKVKSEKNDLYVFEPTPLMSTYLVAVVVSDFKSISNEKNPNHKYSVWANPLVIQQADYALKVMGPVTQLFEKKLGHSYTLNKMDMIALPDFSSGAMENWGLLTYRETNLLYDSDRMSSLANKQAIRNVIAHEITHQWFGDLVSPHWWDYLWLNEGFARYFQCHVYTQDEAAWKLETQFVVDHLQTSFSTDGAIGTHPITHKVYNPTEIRAIFDQISYAKAASIIRMLEKLTGPKIFSSALNRYLEACKFGTGKPEDLFKAFQTEINNDGSTEKITVTELMNSWTLQPGFPVLNVIFVNDDSAVITQSRFYKRPRKENNDNSIWIVPISWATKSNPNFDLTQKVSLLRKKQDSIPIKRAKGDWVILNLQQMGYFRVNYDLQMWNLIIQELKSPDRTKIHEVNRAHIVDDLLNLGRAGHISYDLVFSGLSYLANETEYAPWKAAFTGLTYLKQRFAGRTNVYDSYRKFLLRLVDPIFYRLLLEDKDSDRPTDILLRHLVLDWLCNFDDDRCVALAIDHFKKEKSSTNMKNAVAPNRRSYVYCTAIKKGTKEDWEYLWQIFVKSDYATEKMTALRGLACSQDTELLKRLMDETIRKDSEIRLQDIKTVFSSIVNSGLVGVETVLDYIQNNYKKIKEYLHDDSVVKSTITTISKLLSTDRLLKKFEDFVENSKKAMPELSLQSSLKRAKEEMSWFNEKTPQILKCLMISNKKEKPSRSDYRLPTFAKPETYEIFLTPYFEENNFVFEGKVHIDIKLDTTQTDQSYIILHSHDLKILDIDVEPKEYEVLDTSHDPTTQQLTIYFSKLLKAGITLKLKIKYNGVLRDDMRGFYRSSYTDENKKTKWLASTHFEPAYARRAFPCFDEPAFKAYFSLHISTPKGYHALSNMGSKPEKKPEGDRIQNIFKKSLKMSPYTLAFIVSEHVKIPDKSNRVTAWSRPQLEKYMKYAPPKGEAALQFLEKFTKIKYPLEEMNLVAIPDFDMGAMENWGLVTFREYGLTYDQQLTSATYKRYVNIVISHELVHMWFGNWVTCEWWDYTWLNEGFAEYVSYLVSNVSEPKWQLLKQFIIKEVHVGLESDSSETSHPMNNEVVTPTEAQAGFDKIAYQKSASVLRMLHHSFSDKVFVEGLHSYLMTRQYDVARPQHLYQAMEERMKKEAKKPGDLTVNVTTVMTSWTEQAGYPVVTAVRKNDKVTFTQERFLISATNSSKKNKTYWVPVTYTTESELNFNNTEPKFWLNSEPKEISVASKDKWFLVNVQEIGFYRVNYNPENWQALINLLNSDNIKTIVETNRAQIIDDLFNLARAGYVKYEVALNASKYLARETNYLPWSAYFSAVSYLSQRLDNHLEIKYLYTKHVLTIIDNIYKKLGLNEDMAKDDHLDQLNRELIATWACKYGHNECIEDAKNYYRNSSSTITPNVASAVYCTVVEHGDSKVWDEIWNKYVNALLATDYLTILRGLGCSKNPTILENYLESIVKPESKIRRQDAATAFSSIYTASQVGLNTTITFFVNNYDKLYRFYGNWDDVGSFLSSLAGRISDENQIMILEELATDPKLAEIKKSIESSIKMAKKNVEWFNKNENDILTWLIKNYSETNTDGAYVQGAFYLLIFIVQIVVYAI